MIFEIKINVLMYIRTYNVYIVHGIGYCKRHIQSRHLFVLLLQFTFRLNFIIKFEF